MASEWIDTTVGEQVTLQRGVDITKAAQHAGNVPVISSGGVSSFHDMPAATGPGVVLGRKGVVGSVYYVASDYWPHDTTLWVKDFHGNDPRFVYYFFRWMAPRLARMDVGSANPTLNRNHVHPIEIRWPVVAQQRAIAHILGTLDDKIELNRRMNETLEAIARALFKSWFVDFDPVRAKAEGRDPDLPAHLADLFPDSFEESELGKIPTGWGAVKTGDLVELSRDALNPGDFPDEQFDHFSIPAFDDRRRPKAETGGAIKSSKLLVQSEAVLVSKLNPRIPRIWMPRLDDSRRAICSTEFFVTLPRPGVTREYLDSLFSSRAFASVLETLVGGTSGSHQRVQPETFLSIEVALPPLRVIAEFTKMVRPMLARMSQALAESESLAAARDTLLPRLVSGGVAAARSTGALRQ